MTTSGRASIPNGPTHHRVAENVRTLRQQRGLSQADLATVLRELGTPLGVSALSKVENGTRRVTVDELVALAVALNVSPNRLLLPGDIDPTAVAEHLETEQEPIELTPSLTVEPTAAWAWAAGDEPLPTDPEQHDFDPFAVLQFTQENQPHRMPDPHLEQQVRQLVKESKDRRHAARVSPAEGN